MENRDYALTDLLNKSVTSGQEVILAANIESLIRRALITPTGIDTFIGLVDVLAPSGYTGQAGLFPVVNSTETGLIFADIGLSGYISVDAVTTTALPANTYANGAGGVGATLTASGNGAFPSVDSQTSVLNMLVCVKNFTGANRYKNGVYKLTTLGTGSTAWVLTRATSSDTPSELDNQIVFAAYSGGTNGRKYFIQTTPSPTVGTSTVVYVANRVGGTQGFGQVLTVSDDAVGLNIENLGNLGIGKTPTIPLDVIGDAKIATASYPSGLFKIMNTPDSDQCNVRLGNWDSTTLPGAAISIQSALQRIQIGGTVPATVPTGTALFYMGEGTSPGYAGFTCDYGNDNKDQGTYTMGRPTGFGSVIVVQDDTGQGAIGMNTQVYFDITFNGVQNGISMDQRGGGLGLYTFGNTNVNQGLSMDFTGGTGTGLYILGNQSKNKITIDDSAGTIITTTTNITLSGTNNIELVSATITVNSAPTYTGTVAGAAGKSVVNGLILA